MTVTLAEGQQLVGESGSAYLVVSPMTKPKPGAAPNVWSAVDAGEQKDVFILKQPGIEDASYHGWPRFQSEMVMHELFKDNPHIRRQLDRILPRRNSTDPPALVLEPTETTLWNARTTRPFTNDEIKVIMKGALMGIAAIHEKNLVYADLKPDNIFINGFRQTADETTAENTLTALIGDLGIVMEPSVGKVQPLVYRSPEVHFKSSITPKADIWSWGMIYCHLLQAQVQHDKTGLYDLQDGASAYEVEQALRRYIHDDFGLEHMDFYNDCILPSGHVRAEKEVWSKRLLNSGVPKQEVEFLTWVLDPDPNRRPSADDILNHPHLNAGDVGTQSSEQMRTAGIYLPTISMPDHTRPAETAQQQLSAEPDRSSHDVANATPPLAYHSTADSLPSTVARSVDPLQPSASPQDLEPSPAAVSSTAAPPLKRAHSSGIQAQPEQKRASMESARVGEDMLRGDDQGKGIGGRAKKGGLFNTGLMASLRGE